MTPLDIAALLVCLAAVFGLLNEHLLRLPNAIGLFAITLIVAVAVKLLHYAVPSLGIDSWARGAVESVDFEETLMQGMLGFLLFAGALHVDFNALRKQTATVAILATLGVLFCTFTIGFGFHLITGIPFPIALVFGSLISPTDPVAVLGILKTAGVPKDLETKITGESLFNDGVGVVVFLIVSAIAFPSLRHGEEIDALYVLELFTVEAVGGAVFGLLTSYTVWQLTRRVDDYGLEVLLTMALVMGTYAASMAMHLSGPIAVVVAGLLIGHKGLPEGMSEKSQDYVNRFWHLVDELLNAVLFLLIALELFIIDWFEGGALVYGLAAIPLCLAARFLAVNGTIRILGSRKTFAPGTGTVLTWGGIRGGISVALVLSLPATVEGEPDHRGLLLGVTFVVVVFSILVQGLTLGKVVKRTLGTS